MTHIEVLLQAADQGGLTWTWMFDLPVIFKNIVTMTATMRLSWKSLRVNNPCFPYPQQWHSWCHLWMQPNITCVIFWVHWPVCLRKREDHLLFADLLISFTFWALSLSSPEPPAKRQRRAQAEIYQLQTGSDMWLPGQGGMWVHLLKSCTSVRYFRFMQLYSSAIFHAILVRWKPSISRFGDF